MLFQIYGETAMYQLLGFVLVFTGLVLANEFARRTAETERDRYRTVHPSHCLLVEMPHPLAEPLLVDGPYLFEQNDRVARKSASCASG